MIYYLQATGCPCCGDKINDEGNCISNCGNNKILIIDEALPKPNFSSNETKEFNKYLKKRSKLLKTDI